MENRYNNNLDDTASIEQARLQCFANLICIYAASQISTNLCRPRFSEQIEKNLHLTPLPHAAFSRMADL
jgi:hypothetical protein